MLTKATGVKFSVGEAKKYKPGLAKMFVSNNQNYQYHVIKK